MRLGNMTKLTNVNWPHYKLASADFLRQLMTRSIHHNCKINHFIVFIVQISAQLQQMKRESSNTNFIKIECIPTFYRPREHF